MEKYLVLEKIGNYKPNLIRSFNALGQAVSFVELMRISVDNEFTKYYICELLDESQQS